MAITLKAKFPVEWNMENLTENDPWPEWSFKVQDGKGADIDMTGALVRMAIKSRITDANSVKTLEEGVDFVINGAIIAFSADLVVSMPKGRYVYDLQIQRPGTKFKTYFKGYILVEKEVTSNG